MISFIADMIILLCGGIALGMLLHTFFEERP